MSEIEGSDVVAVPDAVVVAADEEEAAVAAAAVPSSSRTKKRSCSGKVTTTNSSRPVIGCKRWRKIAQKSGHKFPMTGNTKALMCDLGGLIVDTLVSRIAYFQKMRTDCNHSAFRHGSITRDPAKSSRIGYRHVVALLSTLPPQLAKQCTNVADMHHADYLRQLKQRLKVKQAAAAAAAAASAVAEVPA